MATNPEPQPISGPDNEIEEVGTRVPAPDGFESKAAFLEYARKEFTDDESYDRLNREAALDDLRFVGMDQWDPIVRAERERQGRPCLTINVLPQYIGQVIGDRRMNKTSIKVLARKDATVEMAEARSGLIKSIESFSNAERVYDMACEDQVTCGIGNFRISLDYADDDAFEQDIFIRPIPNPLAVVWDRMSVDITGADARHCFVNDTLPRNVFQEMWPKAATPAELGDGVGTAIISEGWFTNDVVRITEFWRIVYKKRQLALMQNGATEDVTDKTPEEIAAMDGIAVDPTTGLPKVRKADRKYAQMYLITGSDILDGPYELPITRLPIIKVTGREVRVGEDRVRFGLVRFAKDPQRLKNYWRSVAAETLAMAPKNQWLAPQDAVEGLEDDFRNAHLSGDPLLIFNKNASAAPARQDPPALNAAVLQEAQMNAQDIKDTTGLQDASLGIRTNEVSGKAINARKLEGDVATVIYHDNLNASIQEAGEVVNQLIPIAYDTLRQLRVIGADDKQKIMEFNNPENPESLDLTVGKYDLAISTGPSYTTQRQEAADSMMQAIQVAPDLMSIAGDLIVKAQDWPGAQEISERLKRAMPPQITQDPDQPPSPEQQAQAQQAQQAQQVQMEQIAAQMEHEQQMRQIQLAQEQAKLEQAQADAQKAAFDAQKAQSEAEIKATEARAAPLKHIHEMDMAERTTAAKVQAATRPPVNRGAGSQSGAGRGNKAAQPKRNIK